MAVRAVGARDGSRRCVQAAYETLRELLEQAARQGLLHANAAKAVRYPDQQMQRKHLPALDAGQYHHLVDAARGLQEPSIGFPRFVTWSTRRLSLVSRRSRASCTER